LVDAGSHLLDIILWTTGTRATEVLAYVDNLGSPVDINSALAVKLDNGAEASISIVGNSPSVLRGGQETAFEARMRRMLQVVRHEEGWFHLP